MGTWYLKKSSEYWWREQHHKGRSIHALAHVEVHHRRERISSFEDGLLSNFETAESSSYRNRRTIQSNDQLNWGNMHFLPRLKNCHSSQALRSVSAREIRQLRRYWKWKRKALCRLLDERKERANSLGNQARFGEISLCPNFSIFRMWFHRYIAFFPYCLGWGFCLWCSIL